MAPTASKLQVLIVRKLQIETSRKKTEERKTVYSNANKSKYLTEFALLYQQRGQAVYY